MLAPLVTPRLLIRPFRAEDLAEIHRILSAAFGEAEGGAAGLAERRSWLEWSALSAEWLPRLHQPPYGDRAVTLKESGTLLGAVGLVPLLAPFSQLPSFGGAPRAAPSPRRWACSGPSTRPASARATQRRPPLP